MSRVYVLESSSNITLDPCSAFELVIKMHLGYFCGTVQIPIFVIQQAGTSKMDKFIILILLPHVCICSNSAEKLFLCALNFMISIYVSWIS